jgi:ABC-type antimicrobial peptide transport system permease subunit
MVLCVKTSLIYTFIRLWSPYRGKVICLYAFLIFIMLYYIIILFIKIFTCNPIRLYWEVGHHRDFCSNRSAIIVTDSVVSVITDLAILIFPIAFTWTLHMPVSKKLQVIIVLGAGSIAVVFSIYRLALAISGLNYENMVDALMRILLCE